MKNEEVEIRLERNYILSAIFFVVSILVISFICLSLLPYISNSFIMVLVMIVQCIILMGLLHLRFFQKEVKYKVISRKKTQYGEITRLEKT